MKKTIEGTKKSERAEQIYQELVKSGLSEEAAKKATEKFFIDLENLSPENCWRKISHEMLSHSSTFALYKLLYEAVYPTWRRRAAPAWFPDQDFIVTTNLAKLMRELGFSDYATFHQWTVSHYVDFWRLIAEKLHIVWDKPYTTVVDLSAGIEFPKWFYGAKLNIANSCFQAKKSKVAIVSRAENDVSKTITYGELDELSNRVANSLTQYLEVGDRVAIIMPMIPEAIAIYLGIVKAGCCVVSIAESFAPDEIAMRLKIGKAKLIFTQDEMLRDGKHLPLYEKIVETGCVLPTVVLSTKSSVDIKWRKQDLNWADFLSDNPLFIAVSCEPMDYTAVLFSSGTTGEPKAIPWTHTTPIKCASDAYLHHDLKSEDITCWPTSLGWMMGAWLMYATFLNQATLALYDGMPTGKKFGEFVQDAKVSMLGVVPTLLKAWHNSRCMEGLDWSHIKCFSSTGECSNAMEMLYLMWLGNYRPIIEYCGGTEIGGAYVTSTLIQPSVPAAFTTKALGTDFLILNEKGVFSNRGEVALIPPAIGLSTELLNKNHHQIYYAHMPRSSSNQVLRRHGDEIEEFDQGFYHLQGRADDTMNLGGIKVSAVEIERALAHLPLVKEIAAIAITPTSGGPSQLVIYAVPHSMEAVDKQQLKASMQETIKHFLNPLFKIDDVVLVNALPKTVSNKIMRVTLKHDYQKTHKEVT